VAAAIAASFLYLTRNEQRAAGPAASSLASASAATDTGNARCRAIVGAFESDVARRLSRLDDRLTEMRSSSAADVQAAYREFFVNLDSSLTRKRAFACKQKDCDAGERSACETLTRWRRLHRDPPR
jgi:hypothetical protein